MGTQMRVAEHDEGWAVFNDGSPVKVGGAITHADRDALVADVESRGVFVWADGSIQKEAEPVDDSPMVFAEAFLPSAEDVSENDSSEPAYAPEPAPATQDPPVDPGADPGDPDSNPTVPDKPKKARAPRKSKAVDEAVEKPKRGRAQKDPDAPRFNDEQKLARAEYAKKYRAQMTDEQKEQARERARERQRKWRENHPDKAAEFAKRSSERRRERYNEDPNFRQEIRAKQKQYVEAAKASTASTASKAS